MRSMFLTVAAALALSVRVFAQSDLPKQMQDTKPPRIEFKNTPLSDILKLADVDIRFQVAGESTKMDVVFTNASVADALAFLVRTANLKYTVIDDKTVAVAAQ